MEEFEHDMTSVEIVPSSGGVFEVEIDDELVYSKKQTGAHPDQDELLRKIRTSRS